MEKKNYIYIYIYITLCFFSNIYRNIEICGHTKKSDKTNKKSKRLQFHGEITEIRIKYFIRKKRKM